MTIPIEEREWTTDFAQSFDAGVWARAFVEHVQKNPGIATDEDTMLGWFANAIMRGYDHRQLALDAAESRAANAETALALRDEQLAAVTRERDHERALVEQALRVVNEANVKLAAVTKERDEALRTILRCDETVTKRRRRRARCWHPLGASTLPASVTTSTPSRPTPLDGSTPPSEAPMPSDLSSARRAELREQALLLAEDATVVLTAGELRALLDAHDEAHDLLVKMSVAAAKVAAERDRLRKGRRDAE